jgi:hypothetical protein
VDHDGSVRAKLALLGVAGLASGAAAAWLAANRSFVPYQTAGAPFCLVVGWSFIGSGLIAWYQRPRNRLGPVMIIIGFAWFVTFLTDAHDPLLFTVGTAVQSAYLVGFAYLILSFLSGRLPGRLERGGFWFALTIGIGLQVAVLLFADSGSVLCPGCPANLLEVRRDDALANGLMQTQRIAAGALAVAVFILLAVRWRRASAALRRTVAPRPDRIRGERH